jgi:argininosuccinate lyase
MVQTAVQAGISSSHLTCDRLQTAARQVLGHELAFDAAQFKQALDPLHFVAVRTGEGGVAPNATAAVLDALLAGLDADAQQLAAQRALSARAEALRHEAVQRVQAG